MPEAPGPDDRLGFAQRAVWSKVEGGYRGAIVGRRGFWEWDCTHHPPHSTKEEAIECASAEVKARRARLA